MRRLLGRLASFCAGAAVIVWIGGMVFASLLGVPMRPRLAGGLLTPFNDPALAHAASAHAGKFGLLLWWSFAVPVALMLLSAVLMLLRRLLFGRDDPNAVTPT